ncbi:MAG: LysE family translocator [Hyphomicrobiales bacterium]|nr:LysE family translocator [Hyphomicrobiales bacterium]MCP5000837.1 LysE family translocator [Hyphomicrobiales bacterium]
MVLNTSLLLGFVAAALVVLVTPGPGVIYVVARSLNQGFAAGFVSAAGLSTGVLVHVAAAVIGLSAILLTSATAFAIVKYIGAVYLIYLGFKMLFAGGKGGTSESVARLPFARLFIDGIMVSVFNPKIALFFLAFLPQFVDPSLGSVPLQIALLGLAYSALALMTDSTYGLVGGVLRHRLRADILHGRIPRIFSGSLLIGLGFKAALADQKP